MRRSARTDATSPGAADGTGLLERWKDGDRNNRRTAELTLLSPVGAPSYWQLILAGRVRHVAVSLTVSEFALGSALPVVGWAEPDPDLAYRIELAPIGGSRPGLGAVVRIGVETWTGLEAGRIPFTMAGRQGEWAEEILS